MEKNKIETGFGSDAKKEPRRIVFLTKKTSAKVVGNPGPQLMTYPHLLIREAIAFQVLVIAMVLVALFWDAPLEQLANPLLTPNPAKAPWYFLGLQELLHFFPPFIAGILIPTLVVIALVVIPYFNVNIEGEPIWASRPLQNLRTTLVTLLVLLTFLAVFQAWTIFVPSALVTALLLVSYTARQGQAGLLHALATKPVSWWVMTWFIAVAICLTIVGTFFRGPGWTWVWPWRAHVG
jgi:menaquinol-cytochrome c reductase cytochrome b/c subunit